MRLLLIGRAPLLPVLGAIGGSICAGWAVQSPETSKRGFLLALAAVIVPLPAIVRIVQRRFDPFEPIQLIVLGSAVLFVARPFAQVASGMSYRGLSIEPGFDLALATALLGVASVYAGYASPLGVRLRRRVREGLPDALEPRAELHFAVFLLIFGATLYGAFVHQVGGFGVALHLLSGRRTGDGVLYANASTYFYYGPFLGIPAALLAVDGWSQTRRIRYLIVAAIGVGAVIVVTIGRGDRLWLMLLGGSLCVAAYLRHQKRPSLVFLAGVLVVVFAVGVTFLRDSRTRTRAPEFLVCLSFTRWNIRSRGGETSFWDRTRRCFRFYR